jgi:hypothetical protein
MLNNAISDYTQIYNQNPNSPKGQHALNNKLVLESMLDTNNNGYSMNPLFVNNTNNTTPELFKLYQNYPNPFNPKTTIKYYIPKDGMIEFKVYDIQGREIFYYNGYKQQGDYEYEFDGSKLASGVYFYQLKIGQNVITKKMVLMK